MKLWVLRHGEAQARASSDAQRALTPTGIDQAQRSAQWLVSEAVELILVSPYLRAQQTAQQVQAVLGGEVAQRTVDWLTPDAEPEDVCRQLQGVSAGRVLLVSHQPLVSHLLALLDAHPPAQGHPMSTASLAALEGEAVGARSMRLTGLRHP